MLCLFFSHRVTTKKTVIHYFKGENSAFHVLRESKSPCYYRKKSDYTRFKINNKAHDVNFRNVLKKIFFSVTQQCI